MKMGWQHVRGCLGGAVSPTAFGIWCVWGVCGAKESANSTFARCIRWIRGAQNDDLHNCVYCPGQYIGRVKNPMSQRFVVHLHHILYDFHTIIRIPPSSSQSVIPSS